MNRANFAIEHQREIEGDPFGKIKPHLSNDITNDTRMRYGSELRVLPDVAHSYGSARDNGDEERVFAVGVPLRGGGKPFTNKQLTKIILDKNEVITDLEENAYGGSVPTNPELYEKAKAIVNKSYPKHSAYRSGAYVKKYKEMGGEYRDDGERKLKRWFQEDWKDVGNKEYPVYRPTKRITKDTPLTPDEIDPENLEIQIEEKQKIKGDKNLSKFQAKGEGFFDDVKRGLDNYNQRKKTTPISEEDWKKQMEDYEKPTTDWGMDELDGGGVVVSRRDPLPAGSRVAVGADGTVIHTPGTLPPPAAEQRRIVVNALGRANNMALATVGWQSPMTDGATNRFLVTFRQSPFISSTPELLTAVRRNDALIKELAGMPPALRDSFIDDISDDICVSLNTAIRASGRTLEDVYNQIKRSYGGAEPAAKPSGVAAAAEVLKPVREAIQNGIGEAIYGAETDPRKQKKGLLGISEEGKEESKKKVMKNIVVPAVKFFNETWDGVFNHDKLGADNDKRIMAEGNKIAAKQGWLYELPDGTMSASRWDANAKAFIPGAKLIRQPRHYHKWVQKNAKYNTGYYIDETDEGSTPYIHIPNPIKGLKPNYTIDELKKNNIPFFIPVDRVAATGDNEAVWRGGFEGDEIWVPQDKAKEIYQALNQYKMKMEEEKERAYFESLSPVEKKEYKEQKGLEKDKAVTEVAKEKVAKDIADEEAKENPDTEKIAKMKAAAERVRKRGVELFYKDATQTKGVSERKYRENLASQGAERQASYQAEQDDFAALPASERIATLNGYITQMENANEPEYQIEELREQVRAIEQEQESNEVRQQAQTSVDLLQQAEVAGGGPIFSKENRVAPEPPQPPVAAVQQHLNPPPPVAGIPVACSPANIAIIEEALLEANKSAYESRWEVLEQGHPRERVQGEIERGYIVGFNFALNRWLVNELGDFIYLADGQRIVMALVPLSNAERINYIRRVAGDVCLRVTQICIRDGLDVATEMARIRSNTESFRRAVARATRGRGSGKNSEDLEGGGAIEWTLQKAGRMLFNPTGDTSHAGRQTFTPDWDAYGSDAADGRKNAFELSRSMYNQGEALDIVGFKLVKDDTSLRFYQKEDEPVIMMGIRGTDIYSKTDILADVVIGFGPQGLNNTTRFQQDLQKLQEFQKQYTINHYYYVATGSSLAGSIADRFLDMKLIGEAVTYNPAIEKKYLLDDAIQNHRIYLDTDPLFLVMGHYAPNTEIRVNANKANYYNPSKEKDYLMSSHSIYPVYNPAFEGGGMEGSGKTYTIEEWKAIFDAKLEVKRKQIEARAAKKKETAKAKRERAKVRRDERAEIPDLETPFRTSKVMKATPPKEREPEPESGDEVETTEYKVDGNTIYVEDASEGLAFEDRAVFDDEDNEIGTLADFREIAKKVLAKEKPKAPRKPRLKVVAAPASARVELREELVAEQPRNIAGEFAARVDMLTESKGLIDKFVEDAIKDMYYEQFPDFMKGMISKEKVYKDKFLTLPKKKQDEIRDRMRKKVMTQMKL